MWMGRAGEVKVEWLLDSGCTFILISVDVYRISAAVRPELKENVCEETQYDLTTDEKKQLSRLLDKHRGVFQLEGEPLRRTHLVQHDIHTTGPPIRQPLRSFPNRIERRG